MSDPEQKSPYFPPGVVWVINSILKIGTGGAIDFNGGELRIGGVKVTASAATLNLVLAAVAAGKKVAHGQATMTGATLTVVTGLATVESVSAVMESDPILTFDRVTAQIGNQSGAPAAGSIILKGWMPTDLTLTTPIAATGYSGIKVNWIAIGT